MSHHLGKICNIDFPSNETLRQKFAMPIVHSGADSCKIDRSRICRMVLKRGCQEGRSSFAKYGEKECNAMKRSLYFATAKPKRCGTIIFVTAFYFVKCELYPIRL